MVILGSTGSIGINTLEIASILNLDIEVLCAGYNIDLLNQQIKKYNPKIVVIADKNDSAKIKNFAGKLYFGQDGILESINETKSKVVVNALVGTAGLIPTIESLRLNKTLALANKESLVIGGAFLDISKIIPIDSEHFSISYLLGSQLSNTSRNFKKLYITASGGAFRDLDICDIKDKKATDALKHPNWKMGKKITIDSATMTNKLFEILEAYWLFKNKNIEAYIERNSHIHALVEFWDGSIVAHFAKANMQFPIIYAIGKSLNLTDEYLSNFSHQDFANPINPLEINYKLEKISENRYPIWKLKETLLNKPKLGVVLNAANEVATKAFLEDKIKFFDIYNIANQSIKHFENCEPTNMDDILAINNEVEQFANELVKKNK